MSVLSKNFDSSEFTCNCGKCGGGAVEALLVASLQRMRDKIGVPIRILSGYRCHAHNQMVGGAINSQHVFGRAADIAAPGLSVVDLYNAALTVPAFEYGGIGIGYGVFHLDVRGVKARWSYDTSGKVMPWKEPA